MSKVNTNSEKSYLSKISLYLFENPYLKKEKSFTTFINKNAKYKEN